MVTVVFRFRSRSLFKLPSMFLVFLIAGIACTERQTGPSFPEGRDRYAEYVAGVSLLTTVKSRLKESDRLLRFRQLGELTGLGPDSAVTFLASLRNHPEKGKELSLRMNRIYETQKDTALTNPTKE